MRTAFMSSCAAGLGGVEVLLQFMGKEGGFQFKTSFLIILQIPQSLHLKLLMLTQQKRLGKYRFFLKVLQ